MSRYITELGLHESDKKRSKEIIIALNKSFELICEPREKIRLVGDQPFDMLVNYFKNVENSFENSRIAYLKFIDKNKGKILSELRCSSFIKEGILYYSIRRYFLANFTTILFGNLLPDREDWSLFFVKNNVNDYIDKIISRALKNKPKNDYSDIYDSNIFDDFANFDVSLERKQKFEDWLSKEITLWENIVEIDKNNLDIVEIDFMDNSRVLENSRQIFHYSGEHLESLTVIKDNWENIKSAFQN